tara:strand:- start:2495 stop:2671 length:177 start_codon:yes stop_codon:yes gene_type:complete
MDEPKVYFDEESVSLWKEKMDILMKIMNEEMDTMRKDMEKMALYLKRRELKNIDSDEE